MTLEVHVLASGSDGNCTVIENAGRAVMIDVGLSYKKIKGLMDVSGIDPSCIESILITHEHSDHVAGAGVASRKLGVPIMCTGKTFVNFEHGDVDFVPVSIMDPFESAGMSITPLPTLHNAVEPCAYSIHAGGKKVLLATDTGKTTPPIEDALASADIAVIEANYDQQMLDTGPYPPYLKNLIGSDIGHMCNRSTGEAIKRTMGVNPSRQVFLAHLSKTNNVPDIARETVAEISGIKRRKLDCLEFPGDTRVLRI